MTNSSPLRSSKMPVQRRLTASDAPDAFMRRRGSSPLARSRKNISRLKGSFVKGSLPCLVKPKFDSLEESDSQCFALARAVEERDHALGTHCERLALIASTMGLLLGLPTEQVSALHRSGYLHDIGKIDLPDDILLKAGPLDRDEWELMKNHPVRGEEICQGIPSLRPILPIIRHHHERWDGSGYPDGLKKEEIPLLARILQIADIYEALTSKRSYKRAYRPDEALNILREETEKGWRDPSLLPVLEQALPLFESDSFWQMTSLSLSSLASAVLNANKLAEDRKCAASAFDAQRTAGEA